LAQKGQASELNRGQLMLLRLKPGAEGRPHTERFESGTAGHFVNGSAAQECV
jgi:hypothetical protein